MREFLLIGDLMFGIEPLLHFAIDLSLTLFVRLLFSAGNQKRDRHRQWNKFFHRELDRGYFSLFELVKVWAKRRTMAQPLV